MKSQALLGNATRIHKRIQELRITLEEVERAIKCSPDDTAALLVKRVFVDRIAQLEALVRPPKPR